MSKYEFVQYTSETTLDHIAQELSKLVNAEIVSFCHTAWGMTILIKLEPAPTDVPEPSSRDKIKGGK